MIRKTSDDASAKSVPENAPWGKWLDPQQNCRHAFQDDKLTISIPAGVHNLDRFGRFVAERDPKMRPAWDNQDAPRLLRTVEGDFSMQVKLANYPPLREYAEKGLDPECGTHGAGLLVWQDEQNFLALKGGRAGNGVPNFFDPRNLVTCYADDKLVSKQGGGDEAHPYLRIQRRGQTLECATSKYGETWRTIEKVDSWKLPAKLKVGVVAINFGPRDLSFTLEEFRLAP